ncbi:hypothetical protein SBBP2_2230009 [Burkholderiales bacterium]|nr:hypothetical protein SBBP2_2230009 [Burkholderiales bacterium]
MIAKSPVVEHLRGLCQHLKVIFCGLLRHQHDEHLGHRLAVWCIERNGRAQTNECGYSLPQALDARMGYSNTLAEPGRPEAFSRRQTCNNARRFHSVIWDEEPRRVIKHLILSAYGEVDPNPFRGEDRGNTIHHYVLSSFAVIASDSTPERFRMHVVSARIMRLRFDIPIAG